MQDTSSNTPWDLLATMQRHAQMLDVLLQSTDAPGPWLIHELREDIAERSARAIRDVRTEINEAAERGELHGQLDYENQAAQFVVHLAQMNGLAQVVGPDFGGCTFVDTERFAAPDPLDWWDGLRWCGHALAPYLDIYDRAEAAEDQEPALAT